MSLQNVHRIEADIKKKSYLIEEPRVTSNDDIAFIVSVTDDGKAIETANVATAVLASTRPDRQTVITAGTKLEDGTIKFELGHTETQFAGQVKAVAQLFDADGDRISSLSWTYVVDRDPTGDGYIPTEKDKTFIEVVLVDGPAIIQEAKDVTAAAQQSVINSDAATGRANTAAAGAESVVNEFATFKDSAAKVKVFPSVDARFEELEKDNYFPMQNKFVNSSFHQGLEAWDTSNQNTANWVVEGNGIIENNTNLDNIGILRASSLPVTNKTYTISRMRVLQTGATNIAFVYAGYTNVVLLNPNANQWYVLSDIAGVSGTYRQGIRANYPPGQALAGYKIEVDYMSHINLTEVFGAGNEPTKEEMDSLLSHYPSSWFEGTVNLSENKKLLPFLLNQIRNKTGRQQEAWISPTLLNGWTSNDANNPVGFYKDLFGIVHFKGRLNPANKSGPSVMTLPEGYRPKATIYFNFGSGLYIAITSVGELQCYFTTWQSLEGLSFRL